MGYVNDDDGEDRWSSVDVRHPDFMKDMVQDIIDGYGDKAHLYALEKFLDYEKHNDSIGMELWKDILFRLDKGEADESIGME